MDRSKSGPLFHSNTPDKALSGARTVAGRVSQWLHEIKVIPEGLQPNHAWRHRFKTIGTELGVSQRVIDAIQGHASRTAGENYGDVTILAKTRVMTQFPSYELDQ